MACWGRLLIRFNVFLALAGVLTFLSPAQAREDRYAAIVVDAATGEVLHSVNPNQRNFPASLTKMMTLYLVFDELKHKHLKLSDRIAFTDNAEAQAPSKLGLHAGQSITVEQGILALVTRSANDVAVAFAEHIGGTEEDFSRLMTAKARAIGMNRSTFVNASGLPNPEQLSTARDMATLARALIQQFPEYYSYFQVRKFRFNGQTIFSHNRLLQSYKGAEGMKTGYIRASGFNLVAAAKRDGRRLVGVVFGGDTASQRDRQMARLLDKGFATSPSGRSRLDQIENVPENDAEGDPPPGAPMDMAEAPAAPQAKEKVRHVISMPAANSGSEVRVAAASSGAGLLQVASSKSGLKLSKASFGNEGSNAAGWSIQVGAYSRYTAAMSAASDAQRKLSKSIPGGKPFVTSHRAQGQTVYRARLTGISESQARSACKKLDGASRSSCHVVAPEGGPSPSQASG
ncbi:MAG: D-alanyl-D-alanine carboxypeptidase [Rhodospirillales bacterium]|nr:MAG: D-alanyl-D-alanine carboxypeptidase [Rhodospirillales bacterium]